MFEYFGQELGKNICDKGEIEGIIQQADGLDEYKKYLKQASIAFSDNKNIVLSSEYFEF
ncbi:hypothetical protein BHECKSOX2_736 [Bathymodiolus heckerae thiotrophic gill symbiont]|uniref:hypothetical protein n=1 Tax=Bathymodiolus heckerae thiotrophic gill symbiont TaxID=1052212 RepID=UPI0010B1EDF3|nr:hypothetical protein [Bathymodiolus heckerae thiotrophic gill symbiont]SMN13613.1 hypothetical protein BHECKSOX2_736 [Bathymodiolus heckerae thiotrophic gill symbiont]SMN15733.1 hypothetical protein CRYPD_691 [uncultured Candidatus Thioglobus sp.]